MKKLSAFIACLFCIVIITASRSSRSYKISQSDIAIYTKTHVPARQPVQMVCCRPNEEVSSSFGARCVTGKQYCVANDCPTGTSECGDESPN